MHKNELITIEGYNYCKSNMDFVHTLKYVVL